MLLLSIIGRGVWYLFVLSAGKNLKTLTKNVVCLRFRLLEPECFSLSLTHPYFNFERDSQFSIAKKYSNMICVWKEFKADTEKLFMKCLDDFTLENSEIVKIINYTGIGPFIPYIRRTLLKVWSYINCATVLSHLFYCNRLEDNVCNLWTRLICKSPVLVDLFQKLESLSLPAVMVSTHKDFKEIFSVFNCSF